MSNIKLKRRVRNILFIVLIILMALAIRVGWLQLVKGEELRALALRQQSLDRKINPKRGVIYDATEKNILAVSSTVETITVNPTNIKVEEKEKIAKALSEIFEMDYETVLKRVKKRSSIETIIRKVEKEKTDELREWMSLNNVTTGINIDEDTKRYYPYNNLASHIIGFTGSDNQGLDGVESKYDEILKGKSGRIIRVTDARGSEINGVSEEYEDAIDGNDIVLTIDMNIQSIVEKYLSKACIDNVCTDGGNVIIMNPKNGDILAMSTYPEYNLNEPYTINDEQLKTVWDTLSQAE